MGSSLVGYIALALVTTAVACDAERPRGECSCGPDGVAGTLILLDDNGGWSWFQDERVIHDAGGQKLVFAWESR